MNTLYYITSEMMTMYEAEGNQPADVPKKDPNAAPTDPNAAPADPNAAPTDPNAAPAPADPNAAPAPAGPNAAPAPADPNAAPAPADPNAAPVDPFANSDSGNKLEPVKKYLMYNKLVELRHYVSVYSVGIDVDEKASKQLLQFISITIDFYDLFDYATIKSLTKDIIEKTKTVMKKRQGGKLKE